MSFNVAEVQADQSVVVLVTGFVVVFSVLLLLIGIIKIYGGIIYGITNRKKKKIKDKKAEAVLIHQPAVNKTVDPVTVSDGTVDPQIVAVIAAAVEAYYGDSKVKTRIRSVKRSTPLRNEWSSAGLSDNIASRRGF